MPYKSKEDKVRSDKQRYERSKEHILKKAKEYRNTHKEERYMYNKVWVLNNKEKAIDKQLQIKYGISLAEYNVKKEQQNNCCEICGKHETEFKRRLNVDHNHSTGEVRGLLCSHCNTALGHVREDVDIMLNMIAYIRKYNG